MDPEFIDFENEGNYLLQESSPCIDMGIADLDGDGIDDITDYFGEAPDMGAFEFDASAMIPGDLNGDGDLNIMDIIVLVNIILGNADPTDTGDLNADGNVDIMDAVVLVNVILNGA